MPEQLDDILEAVGLVVRETEARFSEAMSLHHAATLERLAEEIASLPDPEPGRDGVDRILALPRPVRSGESCTANEIASWQGGLWQSVRITAGDPGDDPAGWKCLVPGFAGFELRADWQARELVFGIRSSDGALHEKPMRMPPCQLPGDYLDKGVAVLAGDTYRPEGADVELMARRDGALLGVAEDWQETRLRGFRGQKGLKGDKGDRGDPGPGLLGFDVLRGDAGYVIVPRFADPAIEAEPIAVDVILAEASDGRQAIATFAGAWHAGRTYARGDAVRAQVDGAAHLCLSIRPDNNARPDDPRAWLVMI